MRRVRVNLFAVLGDDQQCADKLVERLYLIEVPALLEANERAGTVETHLLQWPSQIEPAVRPDEIRDHVQELRCRLLERLKLPATASNGAIERRLDRQANMLFFYLDVDASRWNPGHRALLEAWIGWWQSLDLGRCTFPVVVVARFCHRSDPLALFLGRRWLRRVESDLRALPDGDKVRRTVLPELGNVAHTDVSHWIDENSLLADNSPPDLRMRVRALFSGPFGFGERRLAMSDVAALLRGLIEEMRMSLDDPGDMEGAA